VDVCLIEGVEGANGQIYSHFEGGHNEISVWRAWGYSDLAGYSIQEESAMVVSCNSHRLARSRGNFHVDYQEESRVEMVSGHELNNFFTLQN
jgi:hypothetical protein